MLHVVFTGDGIPRWIGPDPREGSEPVDKDLPFLVAHRRTKSGSWIARPVPVVAEVSAEEQAAAAEADRQQALAEREAALRVALAAEADPLFFKWQRGECAKEDWLDTVAEVKARYPKV